MIKLNQDIQEIPKLIYATGTPPFGIIKYVDGERDKVILINIDSVHKGLLLDFTSTQLKSLLAILDDINDKNTAYPSQKRISKLTGLSVSTVNKNVKSLNKLLVVNHWTGELLTDNVVERLKIPAKSNVGLSQSGIKYDS